MPFPYQQNPSPQNPNPEGAPGGEPPKPEAFKYYILGAQGYTPSEADKARVHDLIDNLDRGDIKKVPSAIVLVDGKSWHKVATSGRVETKTRWAFTDKAADRTYINADAIQEKQEDFLEWLITHEFTHYNSSEKPQLQILHEKQIDGIARDTLKKWQDARAKRKK